jgi:hypothetical protein
MTELVQTGRCEDLVIQHRDNKARSSGGFDHGLCKVQGYRPSSVIATGSFGAVSPPLSG